MRSAAATALTPRRGLDRRAGDAGRATDGPVHGWLYPPTNPDFAAPADRRPPLLVLSHGGPTGFANGAFSLAHQFWTSRGFAMLDVNYGGSAGFGRAYRERLRGRWGIVDARGLHRRRAGHGRAGPGGPGATGDPRRQRRRLHHAAGADQQRRLRRRDQPVRGRATSRRWPRTPTSSSRATWTGWSVRTRRPGRSTSTAPRSHHVDRLAAPILLLQGTEDRVVPPAQTETMAEAVRAKGLPVAMIMFDGEGHGFRRAETIISATQAQVYFLGRVLGFTPADDVPPIPIDNLPG